MQEDQPPMGETAREPVAIGLLERRAREYCAFAALLALAELLVEPVEPGPAVCVGERRSRGHLRDVFRRMKIIAVEKLPAQLLGEGFSDRRLA